MKRLDNPPNPYIPLHHEWLEEPPEVMPEVYEERARSILSENTSPDIGFRWSVNPYRGCQHACAYCYARETHEYLGWGAGTDFETKITVKVNAPELLRKAFSSRRWTREPVNFSGATDCYQPLEAVYRLTRRCLEICREYTNPVTIVTKSYLIARDADLLAELARGAGARVEMSIAFADAKTGKLLEPQAPPPEKRFEAMRILAEAGVPVGLLFAPIIPGLNDREIPRVLEQAAACGARHASYTPMRLPGRVEAVFVKRLREAMPLRADRILARQRDVHGGRLNDPRYRTRLEGQGRYWDSIEQLFAAAARRAGLDASGDDAEPACGDTAHGPDEQLQFDFGGDPPRNAAAVSPRASASRRPAPSRAERSC